MDRGVGILELEEEEEEERTAAIESSFIYVGRVYECFFLVPEFMGLQGECGLNKSMKAHRGPSVVVGYEKKEMKNLLSFVGWSVGWLKDGLVGWYV